jgi:hypothetical protein
MRQAHAWKDFSAAEKAVIVIAVVNFLSAALVAQFIGGDALNGYEKAGRYFLRHHGALTEVSWAVSTYSRCHFVSVFFTHLAAALTLLLHYARK